jgi:hypothetical protein
MGIIPVPSDVVAAHKRRVIEDFSRTFYGRDLVRRGTAVWRTLHLYRALEVLRAPRQHLGMTDDVSAAPREIVQLAGDVAERVRDAEFELEWFYTDPVLNVVSGRDKACLGVWDHGWTIAIAGRDWNPPVVSHPPAPAMPFWRRWFGLRPRASAAG